MPLDVTADPDFMQASAQDQMAYLKSIDQDFAKAQPAEQRMYMAHIRQVLPQVGGTPDLGGMIKQNEAQAQVAGLPGGSPITAPATPAMAAVAGTGIGLAGASVAIPAALGFIRSHPIVGPMIASEAISKARQIPYVGKFIPPYSEMLPFLIGGKKGAPETGAPIERDATLDQTNIPEYAGEAPASGTPEALRDMWASRGGGLANKPISRTTMEGPVTGGDGTLRRQAQSLGTPQTQMQQKLGIQPQAEPMSAPPGESQFPPERPAYAGDTNTIRANLPWNKAARRAEMIDDQGVQQEMNANLEAHGASAHDEMVRENYARMSTGATKGDLVRQAGGVIPENPVRYTSTPGIKSKGPVPAGTTVPEGDMTDLLQKSVQQAKAGNFINQVKAQVSAASPVKKLSDGIAPREGYVYRAITGKEYRDAVQSGILKPGAAADTGGTVNFSKKPISIYAGSASSEPGMIVEVPEKSLKNPRFYEGSDDLYAESQPIPLKQASRMWGVQIGKDGWKIAPLK